jgi:SAM-dependent methyltransferase
VIKLSDDWLFYRRGDHEYPLDGTSQSYAPRYDERSPTTEADTELENRIEKSRHETNELRTDAPLRLTSRPRLEREHMVIDRTAIIASMLDAAGHGLEIGPSHAPLFPKSRGYSVDILDHASGEDLRAKYRALGISTDAIEEVDFISDGRLMHEVIEKRNCYDYIFSSHAIEHVTDFVGYFISCEKLLAPDGVALLAVPDKRFCFDVFQGLTTTGEVLQAHSEGQQRHRPSTVFDFYANIASMPIGGAWDQNTTGSISLDQSLSSAKSYYDKARSSAEYLDVHGWRFTPNSFRLIMRDLHEIGVLELKEKAFFQDGRFEFYIAFSKEASPCTTPRIELLKRIQRELVVGGLQILDKQKALSEVLAA